jgi:hypothetical protein
MELRGKETSSFNTIFSLFLKVVLANIVRDKLVWNPNSNGEYSVKTMCIPLSAPNYNNNVSLCVVCGKV